MTLPYPQIGDHVKVIEKKNYGNGKLTLGTVAEILTKQKDHPRGTKVRLTNGIVGRIQEFIDINGKEMKENAEEKNQEEIIYLNDPDALI